MQRANPAALWATCFVSRSSPPTDISRSTPTATSRFRSTGAAQWKGSRFRRWTGRFHCPSRWLPRRTWRPRPLRRRHPQPNSILGLTICPAIRRKSSRQVREAPGGLPGSCPQMLLCVVAELFWNLTRADLPVDELPTRFHREVIALHSLDFGEKLVRENGDVRRLHAGGFEDVDDLGRDDTPALVLLHGQVTLGRRLPGAGRALRERCTHGLEEPHLISDLARGVARSREGECLGQLQHRVVESAMHSLLAFLGRLENIERWTRRNGGYGTSQGALQGAPPVHEFR